MEEAFKTYLFEYRHDGAIWGFEIKARDPVDAQARLKALAWANYRGEGILKVSVPSSMWITRFYRKVRRLFV